MIPWSPLARGRLTRGLGRPTTARTETDEFGRTLYRDDDRRIVETRRPDRGAARRARVRRSRWPGCATRPGVTAPIVGATKAHHLDEALAALDVELTDDEVAALEGHYVTRDVAGHR